MSPTRQCQLRLGSERRAPETGGLGDSRVLALASSRLTMSIPHFRWLIALLLFAATALSFFDRQVLSVLAPPITKELGMDNEDYSWVVFAFILSYSVMFTVGGWIIDRLGTRTGLALSVGVWTVASVLHAAATSATQLAGFRFLLGVGEGGCFPGAAKGVVEWFPMRERAVAMGFVAAGGSAIGAVVAPPVIVWTSIHLGWRGAFLATGFLGGVWLLAWLVCYSLPTQSHFLSESERHYVEQDHQASPPEGPAAAPEQPVSWNALLRRPEVWGLVSSRFLFDPVFYFYMFWIPQYLSQERGASLQRIGELTWIPFLTLGVSSVIGGWASDKLVASGLSVNFARKAILLASAMLTPISILTVYVARVEAAIALMSVLMFAHGFWITNFMTLIGDLFPSRAVATVVGMTGTAGGIGGFLTTLLIGKIVERASFAPVFIATGVVYPICVLVLLLAIREIRPVDLDRSAESYA
jgi:MFS transporter, ACS family, hexuronate transporter